MVIEEEKDVSVQGAGTGQDRQRRPRHQGDRHRGRRRQARDGIDEHLGAAEGRRFARRCQAWDSAVRGYRTEMEHFAFCVRKWQELKQPVSYEKKDGKLVHGDIIPRCHGEVAMADAIIALTANMAMDAKQRIVFEDAWFDPTSAEVPETKYANRKKA